MSSLVLATFHANRPLAHRTGWASVGVTITLEWQKRLPALREQGYAVSVTQEDDDEAIIVFQGKDHEPALQWAVKVYRQYRKESEAAFRAWRDHLKARAKGDQ